MKFTVERNWIDLIGPIWMPAVVCGQRKGLSAYDIDNIESIARELFDSETITREAIERWLSLNSSDFQGVDDFHAVIGETVFPWSDEESECAYFDCMHGESE